MSNLENNEKYKDILETGQELFWKFGFRRVTIEEICKEAGISKMTFYKYFSNKMDLAITIRTAQVEKERLVVRAGAGIVADSDPDAEQMETVNKAGAIARALRLMAPTTGKDGKENIS